MKGDSEGLIVKEIRSTLSLYCDSVVWVDRLQSGVIRLGARRFVHCCRPGTPDLYALVDKDAGHIVFFECKTKTGRQSDVQKKFEFMVMPFKNIHYCLARSLSDAVDFIKKI